jgi:hypothetical protein
MQIRRDLEVIQYINFTGSAHYCGINHRGRGQRADSAGDQRYRRRWVRARTLARHTWAAWPRSRTRTGSGRWMVPGTEFGRGAGGGGSDGRRSHRSPLIAEPDRNAYLFRRDGLISDAGDGTFEKKPPTTEVHLNFDNITGFGGYGDEL